MGESTNKLSEDTNRFTLRVLKRDTVHINITDALTVGYEGQTVVDLGEINAATFYPVVIVSWDGTDEAPDPDLIQYFTQQRTEWDDDGNLDKAMNFSVQSTGTTPNKLQLKIRAYNRSEPIADDRFYYTLCSLEAGPKTLGDESAWRFN